MTAATLTNTSSTASPTSRVLALAATEAKLVLRNRTVAVSSILVPLALGIFWAFSFGGRDAPPGAGAIVVVLQLGVVLSMGIYVTATQILVARRHSRVLKRMRTTGLCDHGSSWRRWPQASCSGSGSGSGSASLWSSRCSVPSREPRSRSTPCRCAGGRGRNRADRDGRAGHIRRHRPRRSGRRSRRCR